MAVAATLRLAGTRHAAGRVSVCEIEPRAAVPNHRYRRLGGRD
jgi:hypothetical protein